MTKGFSKEDDDRLLKCVGLYGSDNWPLISKYMLKTSFKCHKRYLLLTRQQNVSVKMRWTSEEDEILRNHVATYGRKLWQLVADKLFHRLPKQCSERYRNVLLAKKKEWTPEQDRLLLSLHKKFGPKWSLIMKHIPDRTSNQIKNRFYQ